MIVHTFKQGSPEWISARLGIPTASRFSDILTAKTRKPSASQTKYLCALVAERIIGSPVEHASTDFMLRGSALELEAVAAYEFERDCVTEAVGFVTDDAHRWGCSPDRLVGTDGGLEIKCLSAREHVAAILGMRDEDHVVQVMGNLWITGRNWWDTEFFNPMMPTHIVRTYRDEQHIAQIAEAVQQFAVRVEETYARIIGGGEGAGISPTEAKRAAAL